jgi:recombination protein RecA
LVELSGDRSCSRTTAAVSILRHAQCRGQLCAWVQPERGPLYPPDLEASGIDLGSLVCVHVPRRAGPFGLVRSAELLARSGAFGLVVVDLTAGEPAGEGRWQGRLAGIAREHGARLVMLTHKTAESSSLGPLVGVRVEARRERSGTERFVLRPRLLKAKTPLGGDPRAEDHRTPAGVP